MRYVYRRDTEGRVISFGRYFNTDIESVMTVIGMGWMLFGALAMVATALITGLLGISVSQTTVNIMGLISVLPFIILGISTLIIGSLREFIRREIEKYHNSDTHQ